MSEDFLATVSNAIDNGGDTQSSADIAQDAATSIDPQHNQQPNIPADSAQKVEADVLSTFDSAEKNMNFFGIDKTESKKEKQTELDKELSEESEDVDGVPKRKTLSLKNKQKEKQDGKSIINAYLQEDSEGNLVNKQGEILATSGKSREYLQNLRKEARGLQKQNDQMAIQTLQMAQKVKDLYGEYLEIKETKINPIQHIVKETGLSNSEVSEAMVLMKNYKSNPIEAIKSLLTQAHNSGIDIKQLVGANIVADPSVIKRQMEGLIEDKLTPINQSSAIQNEQYSAQQEANQFLAQYPEAINHQELIAMGKTKYPHMSLPEVWLRIKQGLNAQSTRKSPKSKIKKQKRAAPVTRKSAKSFVNKSKNKDFSSMGYSEIAQSIIKDLDE